MRPEYPVLEGPYLHDILAQPQALSDTLSNLRVSPALNGLVRRLHQGRFQKIVLTGMGSSFHGLHPLNLKLLENSLTPLLVETSELVHDMRSLMDPRTLIIAVSQSGRSAEMLRLLQVNRKRAAVIAVVNVAESPLAQGADATVLTCAGREFSVSCKTYVSALLALEWLGSILTGRDLLPAQRELTPAAPTVSGFLSCWKDHVGTLVKRLQGIRHLFLVGRGKSLAAVGTGALIIKESNHFHAEGMSCAAFRHGPFEMIGPEIFVLVFAGSAKTRELNHRLLEDVTKGRGQAEWVGEDAKMEPFRLPAVSPGLLPILEILAPQMITLALAVHADREPGRFELASKVTVTE